MGPISIWLGTIHPWVKGIPVYSNEEQRPFPRGDNYEIAKIHWRKKMGDFIEPGTHRSTNIKVKYDLRVRGSGIRAGPK